MNYKEFLNIIIDNKNKIFGIVFSSLIACCFSFYHFIYLIDDLPYDKIVTGPINLFIASIDFFS